MSEVDISGVTPLLLEWRDGEPSKPWKDEWFIAETTYGDRVVLRSLPDDYTYDYTTADETYIKADKIKRWMTFPDSGYIASVNERDADKALIAELVKALEKASYLFYEIKCDFTDPRSMCRDGYELCDAAIARAKVQP